MIANFLIKHARVMVLGAFILALVGVGSWFTMPRQEDPEISVRGGMAIVPFPGADAVTIERLVAKPVEDALETVEEIDTVKTTIRDDLAIFSVELKDEVTQSDPVWDDVEKKIAQARRTFPAGVGPTQTNWDLYDLESVVVAITGSDDPLVLKKAADDLSEHLLRIEGVSSVQITADPGEQITITLDDARAQSLGLSAQSLSSLLASRTNLVPGGSLKIDGLKVVIDPRSDFDSLQELRHTLIPLPTGSAVPLEEIAVVTHEPVAPRGSLARFNNKPAVVLGVVPQERIDVVKWGAKIQAELHTQRATIAPLKIETMTFQPDYVKKRLDGLGLSLLQGVGIVALILCLTMGLRMGLAVSLVVPLVALSSLFIFSFSGGLLQQFSIAGLVVSLGLLVDNAIVVSERIQDMIDEGVERLEAARLAIVELTWPLVAATGTTIAAFFPLLLSKGAVGEFTRGIPWLVSITLLVSLVFALGVTPILAAMILRPKKKQTSKSRFTPLVQWISKVPVQHPIKVLVTSVVVVAATIPMVPMIKQEFFPLADREQVLLELELAEGTHLDKTSSEIAKLELALLDRQEVKSVATFVGRSTPRFYYNLPLRPDAPQLAQVLVTLHDSGARWSFVDWARQFGKKTYPGTRFIARILEQGPPTAAPIEIRIYADEAPELAMATQAISAIVAAAPATRDVRHDLPQGRPSLVLNPHDAPSAWQGYSRASLAMAVLGRTRGLPSGQLRDTEDPVPLLVRTGDGERSSSSLETIALREGATLASIASTRVEVRPAAIYRRGGQRVASVLAQLEAGRGFNEALNVIVPKLEALSLPGVRYEIGGAPEASGDANKAIGGAAPYGVSFLLLCLLLQFRSFRRTGLILLAIPLAAVGVVPGLLLWNQPFGFQSLLGVLSLSGIVVNNAIILMDTFDQNRAQGLPLEEALEHSVQSRLRPILLTTATTVLGLTPLLFSGSALWPPMASAMITGLLASTALTLLVVPAVTRLIFSPPLVRLRGQVTRAMFHASTMVLVLGLLTPLAIAQEQPAATTMSLEGVMQAASSDAALARASGASVEAARSGAAATWRAGWLPALQVNAEGVRRTNDIAIETPIGAFVQQPIWGAQVSVVVDQPLLSLAEQVSQVDAQDAALDQAEARDKWQRANLAYQSAQLYLGQVALLANIKALEKRIESLKQQQERVSAMLDTGRGLPTDKLRIGAALDELDVQREHLLAKRQGLAHQLARLVGQDQPLLAQPLDWSKYPLDKPSPRPSGTRQDRQALVASQARLDAQDQALTMQWAPKLSLQGRLIHQVNSPLQDPTWGELGVVLVWTPFERGTRSAKQDVIESQQIAIKAQLEDFDNQQRAELERVSAKWQALAKEVETMRSVVERRGIILTQIQAQYDAGRAILTDVLDAQAALASSTAALEAARAGALERQIEARLLAGLSLTP